MYLKSAQWGFDELLTKKLSDYAFRFYLIGILASLRAVQHVLKSHDRTLSDEHKRVIDEWYEVTPLSTPELNFIKKSRDLILKSPGSRTCCDPIITYIPTEIPSRSTAVARPMS